jgi:hypothetical protein
MESLHVKIGYLFAYLLVMESFVLSGEGEVFRLLDYDIRHEG